MTCTATLVNGTPPRWSSIYLTTVYKCWAGWGGGKNKLPSEDRNNTYHIDGNQVVADELAVKCLVNHLSPCLTAWDLPQALPHTVGQVLGGPLLW
jgi:hypothetical protein